MIAISGSTADAMDVRPSTIFRSLKSLKPLRKASAQALILLGPLPGVIALRTGISNGQLRNTARSAVISISQVTQGAQHV
jgi:hypothetical protein